MASVDFSDYFWGEKNEGFTVLYQNMKCGLNATKELGDFLRERAKLEEENAKAQTKLANKLTPATVNNSVGTFTPLLLAFKVATEKLSGIHNQWSLKLNDLLRDVLKYNDEQQKKHKQVKDEESGTLDSVKSIQDTTNLLQKAKELYKQRCLELEKLKRDNASVKELEKAESKFRKAQDDYKSLVDKYTQIREDFERKMTLAAKHFQEVESTHLKQMREFIENYCQIVDNNNNLLGRVYQEFQIQLTDLTVENLLEQFTLAKHTGLEKPGPAEFDEEKISIASATGPASDISAGSSNSNEVKATVLLGGAAGTGSGTPALATSGAASASANNSTGEGLNDLKSQVEVGGSGDNMVVNDDQTTNFATTQKRRENSNEITTSSGEGGGQILDVEKPRPASATPGDNISTTSSLTNTPSNDVIDHQQSPARSPHARSWTVPGFLRRNKRKDKKKKSSGKDEDGGESLKDIGSDGEDVHKSGTPTPEVDEEGYSKQPPPPNSGAANDPWADFNQTSKGFDSSSDDSDDDTMKRKIKVEIKPVNPNNDVISASVDELRSAVGVLELPPPPSVSKFRPKSALNDRIVSGTQTLRLKPKESRSGLSDFESSSSIRRSHSQTQLNKPSSDLLGLTLHNFDPIDPVSNQIEKTEVDKDSVEVVNAENNEKENNADKSASGFTDLTSTLLSLNVSGTSASGNQQDTSNNPAHDTSHEVQDILSDFHTNAGAPALPPKQNASTLNRPSSVQREKISNSLIALPRPPSRMSQSSVLSARPRGSPSPAPNSSPKDSSTMNSGTLQRKISSVSAQLSRQESGSGSDSPRKMSTDSNFELMKTPSFGFSRGPSPLTLGMSDVVPLAVAFQEVCHAMFNGSEEAKCQTRLIGDMMVSFPAGIVQIVANNPNPAQLSFKIKNADLLESIVPNTKLINPSEMLSTPNGKVFEFKMDALKELLKVQSEINPNAAYFNIDLLKYQVKAKPGAGSCPLQMVAYWKCSDTYTDLRLDYKYNPHAMASTCPLLNLSIAVPVDGGVVNVQSQPNGTWMKESNRALWKFTELSQHSDGGGVGSLRGRFQLSNGPGNAGMIAAQFNCEGTTLSGIDFELMTTGYRLSLTKKRFVSGKYTCVGDVASSNNGGPQSRYAVPPEPRTVVDLGEASNLGPSEC